MTIPVVSWPHTSHKSKTQTSDGHQCRASRPTDKAGHLGRSAVYRVCPVRPGSGGQQTADSRLAAGQRGEVESRVAVLVAVPLHIAALGGVPGNVRDRERQTLAPGVIVDSDVMWGMFSWCQ